MSLIYSYFSIFLLPSVARRFFLIGIHRYTHFVQWIGNKKIPDKFSLIGVCYFVAKTGFEPVTFGLWIQRSNHLSYLAVCVCGCKSTTFFDIYKIISNIFIHKNISRLVLRICNDFLCLLNSYFCLVFLDKSGIFALLKSYI